MTPTPPFASTSLLGQEAAEAVLLRSYRSGRLPHGWLFLGRFGLGKATLAFRFARFLLGGGGTGLAMPPDHPVARQVAAGAHPDLVVVEPKDPEKAGRSVRIEIDVERVRTAIDRLHRTAVGAVRVLVVDQAHLLNVNAANALLKTLEEPRPGVFIVLTADAPGRFPATIGSRVARLRLQPVPTATIARWLADSHGIAAPAAATAAELAQGSPGLACWLLGVEAETHYRRLVAALAGAGTAEASVLDVVEALEATQKAGDAQLAVELLARLVRRAVGRRFGEAGEPLAPEEPEVLRALGARLDRLWQVWDNLAVLDEAAERLSLDRRLIFLDIAADLLGAERRAPA
jgi:DNA polymerase-3 subunit delta'